jgi:hypothetical protein
MLPVTKLPYIEHGHKPHVYLGTQGNTLPGCVVPMVNVPTNSAAFSPRPTSEAIGSSVEATMVDTPLTIIGANIHQSNGSHQCCCLSPKVLSWEPLG